VSSPSKLTVLPIDLLPAPYTDNHDDTTDYKNARDVAHDPTKVSLYLPPDLQARAPAGFSLPPASLYLLQHRNLCTPCEFPFQHNHKETHMALNDLNRNSTTGDLESRHTTNYWPYLIGAAALAAVLFFAFGDNFNFRNNGPNTTTSAPQSTTPATR
jgi:hypothetical protein